MKQATARAAADRRVRAARLGFRVDAKTKQLVERAARLERRNVTDFCITAVAEAAQQAIERHGALVLSVADRAVFFDALVHPAKPASRLRRALRRERTRVERG